MFRRDSGTKTKVTDAAEAVVEYIDPLAKDEKLRKRLVAALVAGAAARSRVRKQTGVTGLVRRLSADRVLRAQLVEMTEALQAAQKRAKKTRSHRRRNTLLFLTGVGMTIAATPGLREKAMSIIGGGQDDWYPAAPNEPPAEV
jgi:hypothetical protein